MDCHFDVWGEVIYYIDFFPWGDDLLTDKSQHHIKITQNNAGLYVIEVISLFGNLPWILLKYLTIYQTIKISWTLWSQHMKTLKLSEISNLDILIQIIPHPHIPHNEPLLHPRFHSTCYTVFCTILRRNHASLHDIEFYIFPLC